MPRPLTLLNFSERSLGTSKDLMFSVQHCVSLTSIPWQIVPSTILGKSSTEVSPQLFLRTFWALLEKKLLGVRLRFWSLAKPHIVFLFVTPPPSNLDIYFWSFHSLRFQNGTFWRHYILIIFAFLDAYEA